MRRMLYLDGDVRCYTDPADGYAALAASVLLELVNDLEGPSSKRRAEARLAVQEGGADFWISVLGLGPLQKRRVRRLLWELAG